MKRALIATVGTGTRKESNIKNPLRKAIKDIIRPDYLIFITSKESQSTAEKLARELRYEKSQYSTFVLKDVDNLNYIAGIVLEAFEKLKSLGFSYDDISIDFTTGTKAMSGALVIGAAIKRCATINYMAGEREAGVVKNGTEKSIQLKPYDVYFADDLKFAVGFAKKLQFNSAIEVLNRYKKHDITTELEQTKKNAINLFRGYDAWDKFDHKEAVIQFKKVAELKSSQITLFKPSKELLKRLEKISVDIKNCYTTDIICDLINNAVRRKIENKYDDAVARLYRASEMLGQFILKSKYELDTSQLDRNKLTQQDLKFLNSRNSIEKITSGMWHNFKLLHHRDNPVGMMAIKSKPFDSAVKTRNASILAHGNTPITGGVYERLYTELKRIIEFEINDFQTRSDELQFPWLIE